jgi:hypothetical protein
MQEEIRKLHKEKSDRDMKIIKLSAYIKKLVSTGEVDQDENEVDDEINKIVSGPAPSGEVDQDNTQNEKLIVESLTTKSRIHTESISDVCFSAMLNP